MIPFSSLVFSHLVWSRIPHTHSYQLTAKNETLATLQHLRGMSPHFVAESEYGKWIFRRNGFLGAGAEILDADSQQQIARFRASWAGGGTLTFSDGNTFHLECKGLWRPLWTMCSGDGKKLLQLHSREKTVDLMGSDLPDRLLSLLILFAWYRILQAQEDAAAAAMIAS